MAKTGWTHQASETQHWAEVLGAVLDAMADAYVADGPRRKAVQLQGMVQAMGEWIGREMASAVLWEVLTPAQHDKLYTQLRAALEMSLVAGMRAVQQHPEIYGPGIDKGA